MIPVCCIVLMILAGLCVGGAAEDSSKKTIRNPL